MSSYNARVPAAQQYQLIMECRTSGLSDFQWCQEHGIHPGTFYNWVSRLRKKACCEIPKPISKVGSPPSPAQEVIRLSFDSKEEKQEPMLLVPHDLGHPTRSSKISATIEISLDYATIRIANGADPSTLDCVLSILKGAVC